MTRSMTGKEERDRDYAASRHSSDTGRQSAFRSGWNECFDHHLLETERLRKELIELKSFKLKYENHIK